MPLANTEGQPTSVGLVRLHNDKLHCTDMTLTRGELTPLCFRLLHGNAAFRTHSNSCRLGDKRAALIRSLPLHLRTLELVRNRRSIQFYPSTSVTGALCRYVHLEVTFFLRDVVR